ncbi:hypothetical protein ABRP55_20340 [Pectobacterium zantedeschiae]|uniref:hypothetical protein n=1 Tax=Pectobacterium zantedeschiae TaxID=2034769 RepID=UPI0032EFD4AC
MLLLGGIVINKQEGVMSEAKEEKTELALVTLPAEKQDLEIALLNDNFIDELLENVRKTAGSVVGDLKTTKGRGVYITTADKVRKSKAAFEVRAKDLVTELKARPALIDANRKRFRDEMDNIAIAIRKPVTDWEVEQERIKAEKQVLAWHEEALEMNAAFDKALAERIESDHEIALLMNDKFDRDAAEAKAEAERQRSAHEEELKRQAIELARQEVEAQAQRDRDAAAQREAQLIAQAAQEKADRIAAEQKVIADKKAAEEKAEREKREAIEKIQREAQQEADRIKCEVIAKEAARQAEEKRIADEQAKREADVKHRKAVGTDIVNAITTKTGISREEAIRVLTALKDGLIPHTRITY